MAKKNYDEDEVVVKPRSKKTKAQKLKARRIRRIAILAVEFVLLAILFVGYYALSKWDMVEHIQINKEDIEINTDIDESYVEQISKGYTNIALLGVDYRQSRDSSMVKGVNCDVMIICSINNDTHQIKLASVYRDTLLEMPDGTLNKANAGISKWDATQQMNVLNTNLDLAMTDYVVVSWGAVATAINMMGGIQVDVPADVVESNYINGLITETVNETGIGSHHLKHGGVQVLDGVQSVAYCRLRRNDNDFARTGRQREVIGKMLEKAKTMSAGQLLGIVDHVFPMVATTLELSEVIGMATNVLDYSIAGQSGWPYYHQTIKDFRYKNWYPVITRGLDLNVSLLHQYLYGETDYVPSATVQTISLNIMADTLVGAPSAAETTPFPAQ